MLRATDEVGINCGGHGLLETACVEHGGGQGAAGETEVARGSGMGSLVPQSDAPHPTPPSVG